MKLAAPPDDPAGELLRQSVVFVAVRVLHCPSDFILEDFKIARTQWLKLVVAIQFQRLWGTVVWREERTHKHLDSFVKGTQRIHLWNCSFTKLELLN